MFRSLAPLKIPSKFTSYGQKNIAAGGEKGDDCLFRGASVCGSGRNGDVLVYVVGERLGGEGWSKHLSRADLAERKSPFSLVTRRETERQE